MPAPTTWELALNLFLVGHWIQSWMRRFLGVDPADQTMGDALAPAVELLAGNI